MPKGVRNIPKVALHEEEEMLHGMPEDDRPLEAIAVSGDDLEISELRGLLNQTKEQLDTANVQLDELIKTVREVQQHATDDSNHYTAFVQTLDKYHTERFDAVFTILDAIKIINKPFIAPPLEPKE